MGQLVGAIQGIGEACRALDFPIVSGNVSLYNETDGRGILPTPTIGGVGLVTDTTDLITGRPTAGDAAVLIGTTAGHLGQSALLAEAFGREDGDAPDVDLLAERRNGEFVLTNRTLVKTASDLSDGGLALAAFEMAEGAGLGLTLESAETAFLFGEDQARYLVACSGADAEKLAAAGRAAGVQVKVVGTFGGDKVKFGNVSAAMADLSAIYRTAFAAAVADD
jgi:phosphoribosylformylglycinamidine synthase subunit PurL